MRKSISFIILTFILICSFLGQEKQAIPKQIRGIRGGGSFSRIYFDGKRHQAVFSLSSVGINAELQLKNKLILGSTFFIANQKSQVTPLFQGKHH